jgi:hypothetical protein
MYGSYYTVIKLTLLHASAEIQSASRFWMYGSYYTVYDTPYIRIGLDKMLVSRWLTRFMISSTWISSFEFFTS